MRYRLRSLLTWLGWGRRATVVEPQQPNSAVTTEFANDRFTDHLKKVLLISNEESQRLHHEYVGTEHLLLGLLKEGSGVGAHVLQQVSGDVGKIQKEMETLIVRDKGKKVLNGTLPLTPRAKRAIDYARVEARNLNHDYVGTEHLLLGLLHEPENVPVQVLLLLGIDYATVRQAILSTLGIT
jgi:ATP-dependent Clp protease ATP-binding subunit ClpC